MKPSTARPLLLSAVCGALLAVCAAAQAQPVFSASAAQGRFGLAEGDAYFYVTPLAGAMSFAVNAATFGFLWGSPDELNRVTDHTSLGDFAFDGRDL